MQTSEQLQGGIYMFNFLKKKNLPQDETSIEVIIPTAEEMQKFSSQSYRTLQDSEILKEITKAAENGSRYTYLFKSYITGKTYQMLEEKGYKVEISSNHNEPLVKIFW